MKPEEVFQLVLIILFLLYVYFMMGYIKQPKYNESKLMPIKNYDKEKTIFERGPFL